MNDYFFTMDHHTRHAERMAQAAEARLARESREHGRRRRAPGGTGRLRGRVSGWKLRPVALSR